MQRRHDALTVALPSQRRRIFLSNGMPPAQNRSPADLVGASEHLLYEIEMLGHTARLLYGKPKGQSDYWVDKTEYFALLESLLTHARSLMNFFHPATRRGQDNLRARDYISDWRPPPKWEGFDQDRKRIDTEISYLSFKRPDATTGWNYGRVVEGLNEMLLRFIDNVPADHVTADFEAQARAALANPFAGWTSVPTQTSQAMKRLVERGRPAGAGE